MNNRKWFSFKEAAEYMGRTPQSFYALMQNKHLELKDYLVTVDGKKMINRTGLTLLVGTPIRPKIINLKILTSSKQKHGTKTNQT